MIMRIVMEFLSNFAKSSFAKNSSVHRNSSGHRAAIELLCNKLPQHIQTSFCAEFLSFLKTEFWALL